VKIRPYATADEVQILALVRELQAYEAALYERMKPASDIDRWYLDLIKRFCLEQDGEIIVAEDQGNCVGYATIFTKMTEDGTGDEMAYDYAAIGDLVVSASARGRGIGAKLLEECERRARAAGRDELRIEVLALNEQAHRLYLKSGFGDLSVKLRKKLA
jgi:ribosomal protein S18 acetylase RimI-like enzyme